MAAQTQFDPIVCVVGFHHARGPEVESWFGVDEGTDPAVDNEWPLLPFLALSDGAHLATEDFSYFTLRHEATHRDPATSLFGIACTRQLDSAQLIDRPAEVTRSTVQKAVVVISDRPQHFGMLREKLSVVTKAWFAQRDFTDAEILQRFQESLAKTFKDQDDERDQYFGLSLRELIHEFKWQTLVLFKCLLLQPKMLFFGTHCERICMMQFALVSLIPGLIRSLQDCADPSFNSREETLVRPSSLKTSERASLLSYMGLPLQIFGKGSLFGPYTPLQQLDTLVDEKTHSYIVGSTNSLLLQQKDRYCDILVNLDEETVTTFSPSLRLALTLSTPDRRWIDFLTQSVNDTWDESNPSRPKTMGYVGSEEFIRLQFEEYLLALLAAVKYKLYVEKHGKDPKGITEIEGDPSSEFHHAWIDAWLRTENFRIFNHNTDSHLFDIVEPAHPCSGGLTMDDISRRVGQQVAELHLDERWKDGREVLGKHLDKGREQVSSAFSKVWADIEALREAQRKKAEEVRVAQAEAEKNGEAPLRSPGMHGPGSAGASGGAGRGWKGPDLSQAQAGLQAAGKSAGQYFSSWGSWVGEKRKTGWAANRSSSGGAPSSEKGGSPLSSPKPFMLGERVKERERAEREEAAKEKPVIVPAADRLADAGEPDHKDAA